MSHDTIIVGAGVAGLRCAQELRAAGVDTLVLERSRGVGGRCATRRFEGQPVDFGPMFFHGLQPDFLQELGQVPGAGPLRPWPRRVQGGGTPCQPRALDPGVDRMVFPDGLKAFPRHLAEGLDIRLETRVTGIEVLDETFQVVTADGERLRCRDLVLALALEQDRRLFGTLPPGPAVAGIAALLDLFASVPCLTLIAGYPLDVPAPPWDILYPERSEALQLVAQDSTKRAAPSFLTLVAQARPRWSREHLEEAPERWGPGLLEELAAQVGSWAARPLWTRTHRWRYARVDGACELARPVRIRFPGGQRLGLAGDVFSPGGGVQAAWKSGIRMAERLLQKEPE
jgi:hypothetical protein